MKLHGLYRITPVALYDLDRKIFNRLKKLGYTVTKLGTAAVVIRW
jgi:hypothetical protein